MLEMLQSRGQGDMRPLITVGMPIYNAGEYLRLAVLSIVKQSFTDWELLIIDDGSTDNALEHIADIKDGRIRILRDGANKGLAVRLNECIDLANGEYFARMDQDDVSYPERFARQLEALRHDPRLDLVATRAITIDENNMATGLFPHTISHQEICARPWRGFYLPHPSWMGKVGWFRKHRYGVPGPYFCEDQELLLRSYRESKFATTDEILFAYRIRGKVDPRKLAKTRRTVFNIQWRNFVSSRQWSFALLATVAYVARSVSDVLKRAEFQLPKRGGARVDDAVVLQWKKVLADTAMVSGAQ